MSYRAWQQRYLSDTSLLGSVLLVNGLPLTLVGIGPPGYSGARLNSNPPELWVPLSLEPEFAGGSHNSILRSAGVAWLYLIGRLKPGSSPKQVEAQLTVELQQWLLANRYQRSDGEQAIRKQHIDLVDGGTGISSFRSRSSTGLYVLSAASALVLLIACANLANLLLARGVSRRQQIALKLSLGATPGRLMRALLTESVLLSLLGGAAGLFVAWASAKAIVLVVFRGADWIPIDVSPSMPVLGFAFVLALVTGIVFGLAPAWSSVRTQPVESLRSGHRTTSGPTPGRALIVAQAALSIVLLTVAGMFTQSLNNIERADLGFRPEGRVIANVNFKAAGYKPEQMPALYEQIQRRLTEVPGVRSASLSLNSPQNLCCINLNIAIGGRSERWIEEVNVLFNRATTGYFETMGTPLVRGRTFSRKDTSSSKHVAVVDQAFANRFFRDEDPIGKHFGLTLAGHSYDYEIIGVVRDARYRSLKTNQSPMYFLPFSQTTEYEPTGYTRLEQATHFAQTVEIRVAGRPESYEEPLRRVLLSISPNLAIAAVRTYREQVAIQFNQERLVAHLTACFSLLAVLLASVGLYGVTAWNVSRRTGEIGIRMALGADRRTVVAMVLGEALRQVVLGLCIGIPMAIVCGRYMSSQLYAVRLYDPFALAAAPLILAVSALLASVIPARRAATIAPFDALRME